jgi:hypothetical protein
VAGKGSSRLRKWIWGLDLIYWGYSSSKWNELSLGGSELAVSKIAVLVLNRAYRAYGPHKGIANKTLFYIFHHHCVSKKICLHLSHGYIYSIHGLVDTVISLPGTYYMYTIAYPIVYPFNIHFSPLNAPRFSLLSPYDQSVQLGTWYLS